MILSDAQRAAAAQVLVDALSDQYGMTFIPAVTDQSPRKSSYGQRHAAVVASSPRRFVGE